MLAHVPKNMGLSLNRLITNRLSERRQHMDPTLVKVLLEALRTIELNAQPGPVQLIATYTLNMADKIMAGQVQEQFKPHLPIGFNR